MELDAQQISLEPRGPRRSDDEFANPADPDGQFGRPGSLANAVADFSAPPEKSCTFAPYFQGTKFRHQVALQFWLK